MALISYASDDVGIRGSKGCNSEFPTTPDLKAHIVYVHVIKALGSSLFPQVTVHVNLA